MLSLFEKYKNDGKITEALLVGRNLFNRNSGDEIIFSAYFEYLCTLAETLPSLADRINFAEQASVALAFYSENAELTSESVDALSGQQQRIDVILSEIESTKAKRVADERAEIEAHNSECLKKLYSLKDEINRATTQDEFDKILVKIRETDTTMDKDEFTDKQSSIYESLTKEHTELISEKMHQLEHKKNIAYNKQAADAFASAFDRFRKDENKYRNQSQLFLLASTTLFAFDASRLFNETLIYYNHVYSYIFSKLDDDGKLALTRYSIECERKLR
ncbi:hypothetical protein [Phascolarctobacterium succinatutens]|uniref:hypothetical protein n=1 Tax=Phascolarctobacterium succinatutens TaxID=626940 RepID=UPI0023F796D6|nr:hypothetical protein [Phascolarctobacterium succinatutens]